MNKEIDELNNVSGGYNQKVVAINCGSCGLSYNVQIAAESRKIEDGCDSYDEYKCPECGAWNRG